MRRSGSASSRSRVSAMPSSSPRRMSTSATSGSRSSTNVRPSAAVPAAPTTSQPSRPSSSSRPSRSAWWSSMRTRRRDTPGQYRQATANPDRARHSANTVKSPSSVRHRRAAAASRSPVGTTVWPVAKDTEKLIRQLSLISYLMAERRPVTATEIRRDVEGYSDMTEDAFARRFYADRAELDALGIQLRVDKPAEGFSEQENYSLAPEAFHLPAIAFTDEEHAALQTALSLLDGAFAYAEPLRLALQQITWGRPNPLDSAAQRSVRLGMSASATGAELSARLAKIDTAIARRKRIEFEYFTMQSGEVAPRRVDPYLLLFQGTEFYLVGYSHERDDVRVFRLSRIRGKVAYATKAEHDFQRPASFDPREYANRIPWQLGDTRGTAEIWVSDDIAWHVERNFGRYGEMAEADGSGRIFRTPYAIPRLVIAWALGYGRHARIAGPPELAAEAHERLGRTRPRPAGWRPLARSA